MNAMAVFPEEKQIHLADEPEPPLAGPTSVKVRMLQVGVCGTDREIARFDYGVPPPDSDHLVIGHESLGQVVAVGDKVDRVRPGDLVVVMVRRPCPHPECIACRSGRPDFCYTGDFTERGIKGISGYMTDMVVDEEAYVVPLPHALRDIGVLTEPLTIGEKAIEEVERIQQRLPWGQTTEHRAHKAYHHNVVVVGAGPVGLLGAMAWAVRGYRVYVYSRESSDSPEARLVRTIGGTYFSTEELTQGELSHKVGNIDVVYEATGAAEVSFDMLTYLGVNGVFIFTGVPGTKGEFEIHGGQIMRDLVLKNQVVLGTVNAPRRAYEAAVADLGTFKDRWPDAVRSLITSHHHLEEVPDLLSNKSGDIKAVVDLED